MSEKTYTEEQVDKIRAELKEAKDTAATLRSELTEAKAQAASASKEAAGLKAQADGVPGLQEQVATLRAELEATKHTATAVQLMGDAGVKDPDVRDYMLHRYGKHQAEAGEKAQGFDDWWKAQTAEPPAVLRPYLASGDEPPAAPATPAPRNTEAGVKPTPDPPPAYTPGSIANMPREEFRASMGKFVSEAQAGLRSLGG
jgi:hypothetical protein